jgi:hypothetical protein
MTIYEPNPDVRPTGAEAGEFTEAGQPNPPTPPNAPADAPPGPVRTHEDARIPAEADRETTARAEAEAELRGQPREDDEG